MCFLVSKTNCGKVLVDNIIGLQVSDTCFILYDCYGANYPSFTVSMFYETCFLPLLADSR